MLSDLRFALRQFAKAPGFTATIVLTLALGIGACTAIYTALDRIVLHPFDDPATERNVGLRSIKFPERVSSGLSFPDFIDLEAQAKSFEFMARSLSGDIILTGTDEPQQLRQALCTQRYFDVVGIKLALGRTFRPEEFVGGKDNVVVLGYACWQRTFGGRPDIIGHTLLLDDRPRIVVGVISERFERTGNYNDMWLPLLIDRPGEPGRNPRSARGLTFNTARLRRGVTIEQAQSELDVIAAGLAERYPDTNKGFGMQLVEREWWFGRKVIPIIKMLFGAVGCLMLIACANVASLLLVRANARQREISVRGALGASRGRLIRQLLTENILMALLGGAAGVILAQWALDFIRASIPSTRTSIVAADLARLTHLDLDRGVLAFALVLSLATAIIFGLAPAWLSSSADLNEALKQGTRGSTEGRSRGRFRAALVIAEVAMAVSLLASSGLLIRSFLRMAAYDPGFDPRHSALVRVSLRAPKYDEPEQQIAFAKALLTRIQNSPGVEAAGTTSFFPFSGIAGGAAGFEIEGRPTIAKAERPLANFFRVSPDYFRAMGIPLQQGRFFSDYDDAKAPRVAIINQTLARQHFPNQDPIGQRITIANGTDAWCQIVGVVGDVAQADVGEVQPAQFYEPHAQIAGRYLRVIVRGRGDPSLLPAIVKSQVQALDSNVPVGEMVKVEDFLRIKLTRERLTLHLLTAFALIGLLIAAIGIYGVIAFSVSQRTVEIGIRLALGAQRYDVLHLVLKQGALVVGIGFTVGIGATFVIGRAIESQLYNTSGHDPLSLVVITVFFAVVAALACWLPARRATKVDPIVALRAE